MGSRANSAALGFSMPFASVIGCYAWNATESRRMARQIRNGQFRPEASAEYEQNFCLFDRGRMQNAQMVALVGLKSTGISSTLSQFLRERQNPFHLSLTDGNLYDALHEEMKKAVLCLPFLAHHLRWDASKTSKDIVIEVFKLVQEQTGSPVQLGVDVVLNPHDSAFRGGRQSSEVCAEFDFANAKLSSNLQRVQHHQGRQGREVALC